MMTLKVGIGTAMLALCLMIAPAANAKATDTIKIAPKGELTSSGHALVTFKYSCASRPGTVTWLDFAVVGSGTSTFDAASAPLTCDGKSHKIVASAGPDLDPYYFLPGPHRVEASFYNDVLGGWNHENGFGPRVSDTIILR